MERDAVGSPQRVAYDAPYYFYVESEDGTDKSIFGETLSKIEARTRREFEAAKQYGRTRSFKLFESDIPPVKRILMDRYYDRPAPPVHCAFIDIEVDYTQSQGFAGPTNPYAPINAVTVYQSWTASFLTAAVLPPGWHGDINNLRAKIQQLIDQKELPADHQPDIHICVDEHALVTFMLGWTADADIISGWNSELFDLPYVCERLLGGESLLTKLAIWHRTTDLSSPGQEPYRLHADIPEVYLWWPRVLRARRSRQKLSLAESFGPGDRPDCERGPP